MKYIPRHDFVLVQLDEAQEATKQGILLAESAQEAPQAGVVLAVGPGRNNEQGHLITSDLKPGDRVFVSQFGGIEVDEAERLFMVRDSELICFVK